jgi:2-keto-3-deoxy-L-rhamnonate aldolase RhmA
MSRRASFRENLRTGQLLVGTWIKTPDAMVVEVLGRSALDVLCLDAEHSPFDRRALDYCILACHATDMPCIVRVPANQAHHLLNALDCGADAVQIPHIASAAQAQQAVDDCIYSAQKSAEKPLGSRGYAGSSRAAGYTTRTQAAHLVASNEAACVIAQIEDASALAHIDSIVAIKRLDAVFIGRADLTVSLGENNQQGPRTLAAIETVIAAAKVANKAVGMFCNANEIAQWKAKGVSLFLVSSDHGFMLQGAKELKAIASLA